MSEEVYRELGFDVIPVPHNGIDTKFRKITRNGRFITIVTSSYFLIPNEIVDDIVTEIVNKTTRDIVLVRSHNTDDRLLQHYIVDHEMFAQMQGGIGPDKDIHLGFTVTNSVDGSLSRGIRAYLIKTGVGSILFPTWRRSNIVTYSKKHTKKNQITFEDFEFGIANAIDMARTIVDSMEAWTKIDVTSGAGLGVLETVRHSLLPNVYRPQYLFKPGKRVPEETIPVVPEGTSLWSMYNDIVALFNSPRTASSLDERTRMNYYDMLHTAIIRGMEKYIDADELRDKINGVKEPKLNVDQITGW